MARLIHRLYNERAFRRERVIRDRSNPLDIYNDEELIQRFRFCRRDIHELVEELSPDLQFVSDHNAALTPALQLLIALRFYANGAFQNTVGDMINVHKSSSSFSCSACNFFVSASTLTISFSRSVCCRSSSLLLHFTSGAPLLPS